MRREKSISLLFDSSRSHSFITPEEAPASTKTSAELKATESTGLVCPQRLCQQHINIKYHHSSIKRNKILHALYQEGPNFHTH